MYEGGSFKQGAKINATLSKKIYILNHKEEHC